MKHDVFFSADTHTYLVDGEEVVNTTEILSPLHQSYKSISPIVLELAANRGKAVHEATELIDMGAEPEVPFEIAGYIKAYIDFLSVYRPAWTEIESIVYNEAEGYIGTLDRAGKLNGSTRLSIVDIKTSQPTKEALVSVCLQTQAYADAYREYFGYSRDKPIDRYGLFLKADGTFRWHDCKAYENKYGFNAYVAWQTLLNTRKMIDELLATGKDRK